MSEPLTITATIEEIERALREYIEATYHIGHESVVAQRARLLREPGTISWQ